MGSLLPPTADQILADMRELADRIHARVHVRIRVLAKPDSPLGQT